MKTIHTDNAPQAIGPYSQAKVYESVMFSSGQIPIDPATGELVSGGIEEQTHRVCQNLKAVLEAAGSSLEKVIKTNCYLKDINDFAAFNKVYAEYFTEKPARSCVGGLQIPKGALVEVEVIAQVD
ncbi:MAG: RidA family protein [Oscillospiraceae bacterium]|nr:RidA family protein [Oscillospiraceae bacterium]